MVMGAEVDVQTQDLDYIDEMTSQENNNHNIMFATSEAKLTIEQKNMPPIGNATGIFVIIIALLGFVNGLDYTSPQSGLVRPDEFVYSMTHNAPENSATFQGVVYDHEENGLNNSRVYVSWLEDGIWNSSEVYTDLDGNFKFEELDPGMVRVDIIVSRNGHRDVFSNRVLLSPPALFEPIGFTTIDFEVPSEEDFAEQKCSDGADECEIREIDKTPEQMDHPLMDPGASTLYTTVGIAFISLALISIGFAVWSMKSGSIALLRTSAVLSFFTMGHYYSACLFGLVAFILTYSIKKPKITLD
ncbi:MAG: carboxypeptidase regulatory-like domain-containing protein [Candidatus Poseidoniales archaeon]|nr:MAG: carboxypeptidase regulatory-like domain-containing protein [Candidatus Poseidoniales archaeon]|tara:strand:+ start:172 stop:1074 length:903 start_codon:yes stop_codon:yes gene_type:complete